MTSPAIDPSLPPTRPAPDKGALGKMVFISVQVALGVAGLAGVAAGAIWLVSEPAEPPRTEVRLAKVEDWPEIKDGIPAIASAKAPTAAATVAPAPMTQAASHAETATAPPPAVALPARLPVAVETVPAPSERTVAPSEQAVAPSEGAVPAAALETSAGGVSSEAPEPADAVAPPLPPPAPRRTAQAKPRKEQPARPQRSASARPKLAPQPEAPPPAAPKEEAKAAPPDDRIRVFGVPLPTGRDIKETFESIGDAVMGRSSRS
jgi:hypothetical protein